MAIAILYISFKDKKEAQKIISVLVKESLIACANIFAVASIYSWKGKIVNGKEVVAVCKTKHALVPMVSARVKDLHSYEVPCIISFGVEANKEFENWVLDSTKNNF